MTPPEEHDELISMVTESVRESTRRKEVAKMGKTTAQVLIEEGEERGVLRTKQEVLVELIQTKFSTVPPDVTNKIKSIRDIERLSALFRKGLTASSIDEMRIE